jgi:hypothetical protein
MKKLILAAAVLASLALGGTAWATVSMWDVATVHGTREFAIGNGGTSLHYNEQGWTDYVWYQNNGSPPGTIAQGQYGNRTGMRTFAATDVAFGQRLSDLKLTFDYHNDLPRLTGPNNYPTINFFLTDGAGHFGIFAPTSSGLGAVGVIDPLNGWSRMTLDLTRSDISTTATMAIYEHNGLSTTYGDPFTGFQWTDIKDLTIAGMYSYQRSPTGGWGAWGTSFDGSHGLALIWGDTVNSNNSYGSQTREIRDVNVSFGGRDFSGEFADATVPEPSTMVLLVGVGLIGLGVRRLRRKS